MSSTAMVYKAIHQVSVAMSEVGIAKTRSNKDQHYNFRGVDDVMNTLSPLLAKAGLLILPRVVSRTYNQLPTKSGGIMHSVVVQVEFDFICAEDGSKVTVCTFGEGADTSDKATNKAMSSAYKYAAFQTFCIPLEGTDGDAETPEEQVKPTRVPTKSDAQQAYNARIMANKPTSEKAAQSVDAFDTLTAEQKTKLLAYLKGD